MTSNILTIFQSVWLFKYRFFKTHLAIPFLFEELCLSCVKYTTTKHTYEVI